MIVKLVEVTVKPGHLDAYLRSQEIWNRETARDPALLGTFCGQSEGDRDTVFLLFFWRSRAEYDAWMAEEHDRIARLASAQDHFEGLKVKVLSPVLGDPTLPPLGAMGLSREP